MRATARQLQRGTLSPMRRPSANKPLAIAYGTGELPAMIASSRDYHAYRSQAHLSGDLVPIPKAITTRFCISSGSPTVF